MKIYVANLSGEITEDELRAAFEEFGETKTATIAKDRKTGERKEYGFVEMPRKSAAFAAIEGLNGRELKGSVLDVAKALSKADKQKGKRRSAEAARAGAATAASRAGPGPMGGSATAGTYTGGKGGPSRKSGGQSRGR